MFVGMIAPATRVVSFTASALLLVARLAPVDAGVAARYLLISQENGPKYDHPSGKSCNIINLMEIEASDGNGNALKPTKLSASSSWATKNGVFPPRDLIDGNRATMGHTGDYMEGTNCAEDAWVMVDYGAPVDLSLIVIYNRDGHEDRIVNADIMFLAEACNPLKTDCKARALHTDTFKAAQSSYKFALPDIGVLPTTTTTTTTTTIDPALLKVAALQKKLDELRNQLSTGADVEDEIKTIEQTLSTLGDTVESQATAMEQLQAQVAQLQAENRARIESAAELTEMIKRTNTQLAGTLRILSELGKAFPEAPSAPEGRCSSPNAPPDTAIELSEDESVLSMSACDGRLEFNAAECTVDPCKLSLFMTELKNRLIQLQF